MEEDWEEIAKGSVLPRLRAGRRESLVTAATKPAELASIQTGSQEDFDLDKYISLVDQQLVVVVIKWTNLCSSLS